MKNKNKYEICVKATSFFLPDQSNEKNNQYTFAYTIKITNLGMLSAKLISRHWIITDSDEGIQEVRGEGIVGQQPTLKPLESIEYTSGATINTAVGTMHGSYQMIAEDGVHFGAEIPKFVLSIPRTIH